MAGQVPLNGDAAPRGPAGRRGGAWAMGTPPSSARADGGRSVREAAESLLFVSRAIDRLSSSGVLGWSDLFAAETHEAPHRAEHGGGPLLWITMPLTPVRLGRRMDGVLEVANQGACAINIARPGSPLRADIGTEFDVLHLFLRPSLLNEVAAELTGRDMADVPVRPVFDRDDAGLALLLRAIRTSLMEPAEVSRLKIDYLARALSADLLAKYADGPITLRPGHLARGGLGDRQLRRVREHVEAHLAEDIHVDDLASVAGVGRTALTVRFRASTGLSPYQYVMGRRVERAKSLLAAGDMSLAEIAIACGFADQAHFATTFRRRTGMRPLDYRAR